MDEYPNENEEFDLMYEDELELVKEIDEPNFNEPKSKKCLSFQSSHTEYTETSVTECNDSGEIGCTPLDNDSIENGSHKRSVNELFGNIDDILFEDNLPRPKRIKIGDDEKKKRDLELIDQILYARQIRAEQHNKPFHENPIRKFKFDPQYSLSHTIPKYSHITVTTMDEKMLYVRFHSEDYMIRDNEYYIKKLIGKDFITGSFKEVLHEAKDYIRKSNELKANDNDLAVNEDSFQDDTDLWVDIYKPKRYLELLSDEGTNKTLLRWIKLWDKAVFNRNPKVKESKVTDPVQKFSKYQNRNELSTTLDKFNRPEHKIVLLCGPPGLGKTTLAHIVAKHAGYNVVEVNASDDRSQETFKKVLETATQMRSVIDKENRPNCVIFDEIDGAPTAAVDFLIKFIDGDHVPKNKKNKSSNPKAYILKRPIICICNDVYVPALRNLRRVAFVIHFPPTSTLRLAERLCEVARKQHVKTDMGTMITLSEKSENDVRSCLSILHFFKSRNGTVTLSDVHDASVGTKDVNEGLFKVWSVIFAAGLQTVQAEKERTKRILKIVRSFGDYERLMSGVYENCLSMDHNVKLANAAEGVDWFCYFDVVNSELLRTQNYDLGVYLPYAFVAWHLAFANNTSTKLKYPNVLYESRMTTIKNLGIVKEMLNGTEPSQAVYVDTLSLILDVLPLLSKLIVPCSIYRTFNTNQYLHSAKEKDELKRVVDVMVDYNLTYVQERRSDGTYVQQIEPDIDRVAIFPELKSKPIVSQETAKLIARDIGIEQVKRLDASARSRKRPQNEEIKKVTEMNDVKKVTEKEEFKKVAGKKEAFATTKSIYKIFGGRSENSKSQRHVTVDYNYDIWYKYKEGYTNAVKKKIKMSALK